MASGPAPRWKRFLSAPGEFVLTEALFLRLLGLIYLSAFASLWPQILGLAGSRGIVPAVRMLEAAQRELGPRAFFYIPTLFWMRPSDPALIGCCALGCLGSLLLMLAILPRLSALACFLLFLSLVTIAQPFTAFQWDALLLEAGFLAIFAGAPWLVWGYRFLLFRLIFESGLVKLSSHDPNWRNLHALRFHFMTQPLPNPVAYYLYRAPGWALDGLTGVTLVIELAAPFLLFCPRRLRQIGVALLAALQICILLTGNYAFFNWLTLALCVWGLDDRSFASISGILRRRWFSWPRSLNPAPLRIAGNTCVGLIVILGIIQLSQLTGPAAFAALAKPLTWVQPFEIVNGYGLFAVMTTTRPEIVIEGSDDQTTWQEYTFPYKPGSTHRGLPWIAPYQPRLDWQMWFAALGSYQSSPWVGGLMYRLLTGEPHVTGLLNHPPFAHPPHYMRALLYEYDFTTPAERARTGAVWSRQLRGAWFGPVSLTGQ